MSKHKKIHENHKRGKIHKCNRCTSSFYDEYNLKKHVQNAHSDTSIKCDNRDKTFVSSNKLKYHNLHMHEKEKEKPKLQCEFCFKNFVSKQSLCMHQKSVHFKIKDLKCPQCDKSFSLKTVLRNHISSIHTTRQKSFECNECDAKYITKSGLRCHT